MELVLKVEECYVVVCKWWIEWLVMLYFLLGYEIVGGSIVGYMVKSLVSLFVVIF